MKIWATVQIGPLNVQLFSAWFDGWRGYFYDEKNHALYLGLVPIFVYIKLWLTGAQS